MFHLSIILTISKVNIVLVIISIISMVFASGDVGADLEWLAAKLTSDTAPVSHTHNWPLKNHKYILDRIYMYYK